MASALAKRLRWTVVSSLSARLFSTRASSSLSASPYLWSCRERGIFSALAMPMTMKYLKEKHQMLRMLSSSAGPGYDQAPNWSNRPPKETILLDGCDYEHWLIVMEFPKDPKPSEDEMIQAYVKTLAAVVGSEEEAKKKIYSVSTHTYTGFGALISEELSYKVKSQPGVLWVLPDSYIDVPNKDYGGDLFIDGKVIPRPQYRYPERQQGRLERSRTRYNNRRPNMQAVRSQPSSNMQAGRPQTTPMGPRGPVPGSGMQTHDPQQGGNQMSRSRMQHPDVSYQNSGMYSPAGGNGMHNPDASYQNSRVHNPVGGHGMQDPDVSYQNRRMHNPVGGNGMQTERRETSWRGVSHDEAHRMRGMQTERREVPWAGVPNEKANEMDEVYSYSNPIRETQAERREANPTEIPRSEGN